MAENPPSNPLENLLKGAAELLKALKEKIFGKTKFSLSQLMGDILSSKEARASSILFPEKTEDKEKLEIRVKGVTINGIRTFETMTDATPNMIDTLGIRADVEKLMTILKPNTWGIVVKNKQAYHVYAGGDKQVQKLTVSKVGTGVGGFSEIAGSNGTPRGLLEAKLLPENDINFGHNTGGHKAIGSFFMNVYGRGGGYNNASTNGRYIGLHGYSTEGTDLPTKERNLIDTGIVSSGCVTFTTGDLKVLADRWGGQISQGVPINVVA